VTPWLLAIIGAILFYKLVERQHKLWLFRALGVLACLAALAAVTLYARERLRTSSQNRQRQGVQVTLLPIPAAEARVSKFDPKNPFDDLLSPPVNELRFTVCNRFHRATKSFEFQVVGRSHDYSTEYKIDQASDQPWRRATTLTSDRIVSPAQCDTLTFYGPFTRYDEYTVQTIDVEYLKQR